MVSLDPPNIDNVPFLVMYDVNVAALSSAVVKDIYAGLAEVVHVPAETPLMLVPNDPNDNPS